MSGSSFPHGFTDGVTIRELPVTVAHPGKIFWVNNSSNIAPNGIGGSNNNPGTYTKPFSTVDFAIGRCQAGRGDIIMVMPGHIEAVTASSLTLDVSGVAIIGLGKGVLRPLFNCGATTSTITVSGANTSIVNCVVKATVDSVVAGLTISGANVTLDIETLDTSAAVEFISPIVTTATADNPRIKWKHRGFAAGDAMTRGIDLVGCRDAMIDVDFFGIASVAVVNMRTTACDNVQVRGSFYNDSVALTKNVVNSTTSTWSVQGYDAKAGLNFAGSDDTSVAYIGTGTAALTTALYALPQAKESGAKTLGAGATTLFTITGGPIKVLEIVGIVTTNVQAQATSCKLTTTTVSPAATVDMSAAAVDITGIAAGTSIRHINTTAILTPVTAGFVMEGNAFATNDTQFLCPEGTINLNNASAANTGAINWYLRYVPLSPNTVVS